MGYMLYVEISANEVGLAKANDIIYAVKQWDGVAVVKVWLEPVKGDDGKSGLEARRKRTSGDNGG